MKPIGGYFEWEFPPAKKFTLHKDAIFLNSGRHAFEYILRILPCIKKIWIPYFTCDAILYPLQKLNIPWNFYHINKKLEILNNIELSEGEYILYTNYYGVKDEYCKKIAAIYGNKAIIDNAQALFCKSIPEASQFYSPRKFMGMPDGGLAIAIFSSSTDTLTQDTSFDRCSHLLKRTELSPSEGYADFKACSKKISEAPLCQMSRISKSILLSVDLESIKQKRRQNFFLLHEILSNTNVFDIPNFNSFECPLVYPYWSNNGDVLKKKLIEQQIFVATYWPNVFEWTKQDDLECQIANHMVCIPIDQRYGKEDMERIAKIILF